MMHKNQPSSVLNWLPLACILVITFGCTPGQDSLHEDDHEKPHHWPTDMMDAAAKIRERIIVGDEAKMESALQELSDLVEWAPEIAGDTDIVESDWIPIYELSETLRDHLDAGDVMISDVDGELEQLAVLLESSAEANPADQVEPADDAETMIEETTEENLLEDGP